MEKNEAIEILEWLKGATLCIGVDFETALQMGIDALRNGGEMNQGVKFDEGKPRLSLCPTYIMTAIARVREHGVRKYGSVDSWKEVETERYIDALLRHTMAFVDNPEGLDADSGLPHLWHVCCNAAFLAEQMKEITTHGNNDADN